MVQRLLKISTLKVTEAIQVALREYAQLRKSVVQSDGLLVAILEQQDSVGRKIIEKLCDDPESVISDIVDQCYENMSAVSNLPATGMGQILISKDIENLFEEADRTRKDYGDSFISTGAVFLSFFSDQVPKSKEILENNGLDFKEVKKAYDEIRGSKKVMVKDAESKQSVLDEYTTDLTELARKEQVDPVIGREEEIEAVIQIISRRKKNNPILVGDPGVGKTVIAEGLADKIAKAEVPDFLLDKRVLSLEIATLVAGAKLQGEFEERLQKIKDEVIASQGQIILFIDEIHTVVGAGRSGGALDAANILKPALARGHLQCIGATTTKEYKQYIESDKALERRFQVVKVEEPSVEESITILRGISPRYETHHSVLYTDEAIEAAVKLSRRYMPDRALPDKAIDLLDEAGATTRLKILKLAPELKELENKKTQIEIDKKEAFEKQDFESMSNMQMKLLQISDEIEKIKEKLHKEDKRSNEIGYDTVAEVVSKRTKIPVTKMIETEAKRLLALEDEFKKRIIGQDYVVNKVSHAIRRNRSGLRKEGKPIASFLFLGPTGVGKTEMAKAIAAEVMDNEENIIRIDMSEYMESHSVSKLIGSPPGYVGYHEGGQLTEKVKRTPYSVVLFDEFEKAHPDVFNLFLQILDEGWITDSEGQKISFTNTVIICTSNLGAEAMMERKNPIGIGNRELELKQSEYKDVIEIAKKHFRPEFINRLDDIVVFNKLTSDQFNEIFDILLSDLKKRIAELQWDLEIDDSVKDFLLERVDTEKFGARPLKRKLEYYVENELANVLLRHVGNKKSKLSVTIDNDKVAVKAS